MEAAKYADFIGCGPGNACEQADAETAYVQADTNGTPSWICLPEHLRPPEWAGIEQPVLLLRKALYGHPDSGTFWENHSQEALIKSGLVPVADWPSCYTHPRLNLVLVCYVDDFKLVGPKENLAEGWKLIRKRILTDDPKPSKLFLGC